MCNATVTKWQAIALGCVALLVTASVVAAPLADPTAPPGRVIKSRAAVPATLSPTNTPAWVLVSTLIAPHRRSAVINQQVVAVGERVEGAVVTEITSTSVTLRFENQDIVLRLKDYRIKQPTRNEGSDKS